MWVQEMSRSLEATVIHAIKKRLTPVPACMGAHGHPEITSAPERGGREKSEADDRDDAYFGFTGIAHVHGSKSQPEDYCGRPEADAIGEGV